MLSTKNLTKTYKPKKGVPVKALDNVSLQFPDSGMVFLLGKSGSGKSTLLNLLGGLDSYDSGDIVVKGASTKYFRQSHFDSYRNTYVGFIFQEYNILDEFSVGANIALAIELQGRKATDKEIEEILKKVELEGYGDRKPGELSGGQKQRVAIARALVKNPEIIMADEPTGALDSSTGIQVFDTLKKLSREKLVIVVSHDREFATKYGDRIIELSDGKVISDVSRCGDDVENENITFDGTTVTLAKGYHLSEEDRIRINEYIDALQSEATVEISNHSQRGFAPTDMEKLKSDAKPSRAFSLIKSKLPIKSAFRIGVSGLGHKKFRLVMTVLLSCIAFGLFGLSDTFGAYNHITACTNSIVDSDIKYASFTVNRSKETEEGKKYWITYGNKMTSQDMKEIKDKMGIDTVGVYKPRGDMSIFSQINGERLEDYTKSEYNTLGEGFVGFGEINEVILGSLGYSVLAGELPMEQGQVCISEYMYETFKQCGYVDSLGKESSVNYYHDIIGKTLSLGGTEYTVCGIVDTHTDISRYNMLLEDTKEDSDADGILKYVMASEFNSMVNYSLSRVAMVGEGAVGEMTGSLPKASIINDGWIYFYGTDTNTAPFVNVDPMYMTTLDEVDMDRITWVDGEKKSLGDKEIIVSGGTFFVYDEDGYSIEVTEDIINDLALKELSCYRAPGGDDGSNAFEEKGYKIVGIYESRDDEEIMNSAVIVSDSLMGSHTTQWGIYDFAVGAMPEEKDEIRSMVKESYSEEGDSAYVLQNAVTFELDGVNSVLKTLSKVFFWIGIGFALFAGIMLANFIATSISYKKQEIGILRAIGSRGTDVFRIFFSESFVIAMINFVLSAIGVGVATAIINHFIRTGAYILVTILHFGARQIALLFLLSLVIAFAASFIPVKRIAAKKPVDAIRNR